jgi:hypothetical protein
VSANHRTIQSFYKVPFGNMTGSAGDTDRGLRIKERILEHLEAKDRFAPEDVLSIHYDSVNVWKREIIRLGYKILATDSEGLSNDAQKTLRHLRRWYDQGAESDLSVPGTELVNEMNVIFRGGVFGLVGKYGGGVSGLARFAKSVRSRDAANPGRPIPEEERSFVDQVLAQAWNRTEGKYGSKSQEWHTLAREMLCRQKMGYMESLDGFASLDERYDVTLPWLTTVDGATVLSQRAQSYTQYVPLHNADEAMTILPIGNSDNPQSVFRFSTYGDWSAGELHPAPLSRETVGTICVSIVTFGRRLPQPRERPSRTGERTRGGQRAEAVGKPLPGRKPADPVLEAAIRYLNRRERTAEEVETKLDELEDYVSGDAERTRQLVGGLELFLYLMRESQAGRLPIQYGTPQTLQLVEQFYQRFADR